RCALRARLRPSACSYVLSRTYRVSTSFPTRRSSDLCGHIKLTDSRVGLVALCLDLKALVAQIYVHVLEVGGQQIATHCVGCALVDRKSTRLNSSHVRISYAVFCLKIKTDRPRQRRTF